MKPMNKENHVVLPYARAPRGGRIHPLPPPGRGGGSFMPFRMASGRMIPAPPNPHHHPALLGGHGVAFRQAASVPLYSGPGPRGPFSRMTGRGRAVPAALAHQPPRNDAYSRLVNNNTDANRTKPASGDDLNKNGKEIAVNSNEREPESTSKANAVENTKPASNSDLEDAKEKEKAKKSNDEKEKESTTETAVKQQSDDENKKPAAAATIPPRTTIELPHDNRTSMLNTQHNKFGQRYGPPRNGPSFWRGPPPWGGPALFRGPPLNPSRPPSHRAPIMRSNQHQSSPTTGNNANNSNESKQADADTGQNTKPASDLNEKEEGKSSTNGNETDKDPAAEADARHVDPDADTKPAAAAIQPRRILSYIDFIDRLLIKIPAESWPLCSIVIRCHNGPGAILQGKFIHKIPAQKWLYPYKNSVSKVTLLVEGTAALKEEAYPFNAPYSEDVLDQVIRSEFSLAAPYSNLVSSGKRKNDPTASSSTKNKKLKNTSDAPKRKPPSTFEQRFKELEAFHRRNSHCRVPLSFVGGLGYWTSSLRVTYRTYSPYNVQRDPDQLRLAELTADRVARLDALGFEWQVRSEVVPFEKRLEALKEFKAIHGHLRVPCITGTSDGELGKWVGRVRQKGRESHSKRVKLSEEQMQQLDEIGFEWRLAENTGLPFKDRLEQCRNYRQEHGHLKVPAIDLESEEASSLSEKDKSFRVWAQSMRTRYHASLNGRSRKKEPLTNQQIKELQKLEFDFTPAPMDIARRPVAFGYGRGRKPPEIEQAIQQYKDLTANDGRLWPKYPHGR